MWLSWTGYDKFDWLHSSSTTILTSLLIHIIDIVSWNPLLVQKLLQLLKVIINDRFIEALCLFRVKPWRLSQLNTTISQEKLPNPFGGGLMPCDLGDLVFNALFTDRLACFLLSVGKMLEVTPGTLDVKSRPTRCQKELQLQLMCCTPFRLLFQDFRTEGQRSEAKGKIGVGLREWRSKRELIQYSNWGIYMTSLRCLC